jgi:hypothetical protein
LPRFISRIARRTLLPLARLYLRAMVGTCWFGTCWFVAVRGA